MMFPSLRLPYLYLLPKSHDLSPSGETKRGMAELFAAQFIFSAEPPVGIDD